MGSWIKNNKFEAFLLLLVIIVAVGAYLHGSKKGSLYEAAKEGYGAHASAVSGLKSKRPYPTPANADEFEAQVGGRLQGALHYSASNVAGRHVWLEAELDDAEPAVRP